MHFSPPAYQGNSQGLISSWLYMQGELEKLPAMGAPPPQPAPPAGRKPKPVLLE